MPHAQKLKPAIQVFDTGDDVMCRLRPDVSDERYAVLIATLIRALCRDDEADFIRLLTAELRNPTLAIHDRTNH